jgi:hypothetical protein
MTATQKESLTHAQAPAEGFISLLNPISPDALLALSPKGFPDPRRPVMSALVEAEARLMRHLFCELHLRTQDIGSLEDKNAWLAEALYTIQQLMILMMWIYPPPKAQTLDQRIKLAGFVSQNAQAEPLPLLDLISKKILRGAGPRGRQAKKRQLVVSALELRLNEGSEKWSWMELAKELCDCGKMPHTAHCRETLRIEVLELHTVLENLCGWEWEIIGRTKQLKRPV